MESEILIGILVRLLPTIAVFTLAFVAAADKNSRERWGNLLYQVGSIRPDQREDPKIGKGVKWPFFVVAFCLLFWPIQYSLHATRKIDPTNNDLKPQAAVSDLKQAEPNASTTNSVSADPSATPGTDATNAASTTPATSATPPPTSDLRPASP